ncbi:trxr-1, partial [Symbiodinium microadriaticum]
FLRAFDSDASRAVVQDLTARGVQFRTGLSLSAITSEASHAGKPKMVRARNAETGEEVSLGEFDTVMFAIGRQPLSPSRFGAQNAGVETAGGRVTGGHAWPGHKLCELSSHVPESSTCPGVFAVGDVLQGSSELTPVAIQQGVRVARLLNQAGWKYGASRATEDPASATAFSLDGLDLGGLGMELAVPPPVDPTLVPTAVFTPAEYACVGLSEEEAIRQYGQDGVEVVWSKFDDLEARLASQH